MVTLLLFVLALLLFVVGLVVQFRIGIPLIIASLVIFVVAILLWIIKKFHKKSE